MDSYTKKIQQKISTYDNLFFIEDVDTYNSCIVLTQVNKTIPFIIRGEFCKLLFKNKIIPSLRRVSSFSHIGINVYSLK